MTYRDYLALGIWVSVVLLIFALGAVIVFDRGGHKARFVVGFVVGIATIVYLMSRIK